MKIIFDNIIFWLQRSGGGSVYWSELIKRADKLEEIEVLFYDQNVSSKNFFRTNLSLKNIKKESLYNIRIIRYIPFTEKVNHKSIFHSSYFRISNSKNAINVTTIHDFTTEKFRKGLARWVNFNQKKYAIKKSKGIICISENTKKDLLYFFPDTDESKIKVIYNGVSEDFFYINEDFNINEKDKRFVSLKNQRYLLYVGHRTNYKNFNLAVKAAQKFKKNYKFVVVGESFNRDEKKYISKYFENDEIILINGLQNKELNFLYNKAFALLYPSSYEGFGIPIVEAMKTRCPVIAADNSSIPEVAGNAAILIKDIDEKKIAEAINKLQVGNFRNQLIEKGVQQSKKFDWDYTFRSYIDYYKKLYNESNI